MSQALSVTININSHAAIDLHLVLYTRMHPTTVIVIIHMQVCWTHATVLKLLLAKLQLNQ